MTDSDPQVLLATEQIAGRIRELGEQIGRDYKDRDLVAVVVLKGSFMFAADLVRSIDLPMEIDFLGVRSYGDSTHSSGVVQITSDLMRFLLDNLATRAPRSLRLCALLHKPARARVQVPIDYLGFSIDNVFVVGYGLDHAQRHRNLPYVGVLSETGSST
jgi:hypoxanthine phosphoribosyltransferase